MSSDRFGGDAILTVSTVEHRICLRPREGIGYLYVIISEDTSWEIGINKRYI